MRSRALLFASLVALSLAGCASETITAPPEEVRPIGAVPVTLPPGTIARADLLALLDAGVPAFLSQLVEQPYLDGDRLVGWQLLAFFPNDPRFAGGPIERGDVVVRVNGRSLARPEQLMDAWNRLRTSSVLDVDLLRDGRSLSLHYAIADGARADVASPHDSLR